MPKVLKDRMSTVRLGSQLDDELDQLAKDMDIPRSHIVRKAVKLFIARQRHIDELLCEAKERHAEYQATGRGALWEDVASWLEDGAKPESRPEIKTFPH